MIAVLVNALNDNTLSYIKERVGLEVELILEMNNGDIVRTGTDSTWRTAPARAFSRHTPRISIQYGFEEQFDARLEDPLWRETDFDDQTWERAVVIHEPPWKGLHQRTLTHPETIAVEPLDDLLHVLNAVNSPALVVMLNTGHVHVTANKLA